MRASAHRYSCDQLGACQARPTPCAGCIKPKPFAPGAIERPAAKPPAACSKAAPKR